MSLGKTVRRLREARGWSGAELARRAGLDQPTVSRIENAAPTSNISIWTIAKIASALEVTVDTLLSQSTVDVIVDRIEKIEAEVAKLKRKK